MRTLPESTIHISNDPELVSRSRHRQSDSGSHVAGQSQGWDLNPGVSDSNKPRSLTPQKTDRSQEGIWL